MTTATGRALCYVLPSMKEIFFPALPDEGVSHAPDIRKRVALRKGDIPHLTQYARAVFKPGQVARRHTHADMWELFLCRSGDGRMTVAERVLRLRPGMLVVVEPGETHQVEADGDTDLVVDVLGLAD